MVYIDCTGDKKKVISRVTSNDAEKTFGETKGWDKIGYVKIGGEYGVISLEAATSFDYAYYVHYKQIRGKFLSDLKDFNKDMGIYNSEVSQYNKYIFGKTFYVGTPEEKYASQWKREIGQKELALDSRKIDLDEIGDSLGAFWEPGGIVKEVNIYW